MLEEDEPPDWSYWCFVVAAIDLTIDLTIKLSTIAL